MKIIFGFNCFRNAVNFKMQDFLWINSKNIATLDDQCKNAVHRANQLFEPGQKDGDVVIETRSFEQALYLVKLYLEVDLWAHPCGHNLTCSYFLSAQHILKELCIRGILTLSGHLINSMSSLEFAVVVHDDAIEAFLEMLMFMHTLDIDIWIEYCKNLQTLGHSSLVDGEARVQGINDVFKISNVCLGICGIHKMKTKNVVPMEVLASQEHTLFKVRMVSNSQLVEDILLKYWMVFNAQYGKMNKNILDISITDYV